MPVPLLETPTERHDNGSSVMYNVEMTETANCRVTTTNDWVQRQSNNDDTRYVLGPSKVRMNVYE